jgi:hypothetical protein
LLNDAFAVPLPLAVVCHDAGAANLILAWITAGDLAVDAGRAFLAGPAARLWEERFGSAPRAPSIEAALTGAAALLSGTGWASDLEHRARAAARAAGLRSVAVIDHWVNYAARFERGPAHAPVRIWPDEVWVSDEYAVAEAKQALPGLQVRLLPNRYLEQQVRKIGPLEDAGHDVLVVLEPIRNNWGRDEPGEFQALDYLVQYFDVLGLPEESELRLRPHPSEPPGKYAEWLSRRRVTRVSLDNAPNLALAITRCRVVAGCESAAMVVALAAGRRVVCTLPPWAPPLRLPHLGIVHLHQLAQH